MVGAYQRYLTAENHCGLLLRELRPFVEPPIPCLALVRYIIFPPRILAIDAGLISEVASQVLLAIRPACG